MPNPLALLHKATRPAFLAVLAMAAPLLRATPGGPAPAAEVTLFAGRLGPALDQAPPAFDHLAHLAFLEPDPAIQDQRLQGRWLVVDRGGLKTVFRSEHGVEVWSWPDSPTQITAIATRPKGSLASNPYQVVFAALLPGSEPKSELWAIDLAGRLSRLGEALPDPGAAKDRCWPRFGLITHLTLSFDGVLDLGDGTSPLLLKIFPSGKVNSGSRPPFRPWAATGLSGPSQPFQQLLAGGLDPASEESFLFVNGQLSRGRQDAATPPLDLSDRIHPGWAAAGQALAWGAENLQPPLRIRPLGNKLVMLQRSGPSLDSMDLASGAWATLIPTPGPGTAPRGGPLALLHPDLPPEACAALVATDLVIRADGKGMVATQDALLEVNLQGLITFKPSLARPLAPETPAVASAAREDAGASLWPYLRGNHLARHQRLSRTIAPQLLAERWHGWSPLGYLMSIGDAYGACQMLDLLKNLAPGLLKELVSDANGLRLSPFHYALYKAQYVLAGRLLDLQPWIQPLNGGRFLGLAGNNPMHTLVLAFMDNELALTARMAKAMAAWPGYLDQPAAGNAKETVYQFFTRPEVVARCAKDPDGRDLLRLIQAAHAVPPPVQLTCLAGTFGPAPGSPESGSAAPFKNITQVAYAEPDPAQPAARWLGQWLVADDQGLKAVSSTAAGVQVEAITTTQGKVTAMVGRPRASTPDNPWQVVFAERRGTEPNAVSTLWGIDLAGNKRKVVPKSGADPDRRLQLVAFKPITGLVLRPDGNLNVLDALPSLMGVSPQGRVATLGGFYDWQPAGQAGPVSGPRRQGPGLVALAPWSDQGGGFCLGDGHSVSFLTASGALLPILGQREQAGFQDWAEGDPALYKTACLGGPTGLAVFNQGLFILDPDNRALRALNVLNGRLWTVVGPHSFDSTDPAGPPGPPVGPTAFAVNAQGQCLIATSSGLAMLDLPNCGSQPSVPQPPPEPMTGMAPAAALKRLLAMADYEPDRVAALLEGPGLDPGREEALADPSLLLGLIRKADGCNVSRLINLLEQRQSTDWGRVYQADPSFGNIAGLNPLTVAMHYNWFALVDRLLEIPAAAASLQLEGASDRSAQVIAAFFEQVIQARNFHLADKLAAADPSGWRLLALQRDGHPNETLLDFMLKSPNYDQATASEEGRRLVARAVAAAFSRSLSNAPSIQGTTLTFNAMEGGAPFTAVVPRAEPPAAWKPRSARLGPLQPEPEQPPSAHLGPLQPEPEQPPSAHLGPLQPEPEQPPSAPQRPARPKPSPQRQNDRSPSAQAASSTQAAGAPDPAAWARLGAALERDLNDQTCQRNLQMLRDLQDEVLDQAEASAEDVEAILQGPGAKKFQSRLAFFKDLEPFIANQETALQAFQSKRRVAQVALAEQRNDDFAASDQLVDTLAEQLRAIRAAIQTKKDASVELKADVDKALAHAAKARSKALTEAKAKAAQAARAEALAQAEAQAKAEAAAQAEAEAAARAEAKARKAEAKALALAQAKAQAEAKALALTQAKAQAEAKAAANARAEAEAQAGAQAKAKAQAAAQAEAKAQAQAAAQAKAKAQAQAAAEAAATARARADRVAAAGLNPHGSALPTGASPEQPAQPSLASLRLADPSALPDWTVLNYLLSLEEGQDPAVRAMEGEALLGTCARVMDQAQQASSDKRELTWPANRFRNVLFHEQGVRYPLVEVRAFASRLVAFCRDQLQPGAAFRDPFLTEVCGHRLPMEDPLEQEGAILALAHRYRELQNFPARSKDQAEFKARAMGFLEARLGSLLSQRRRPGAPGFRASFGDKEIAQLIQQGIAFRHLDYAPLAEVKVAPEPGLSLPGARELAPAAAPSRGQLTTRHPEVIAVLKEPARAALASLAPVAQDYICSIIDRSFLQAQQRLWNGTLADPNDEVLWQVAMLSGEYAETVQLPAGGFSPGTPTLLDGKAPEQVRALYLEGRDFGWFAANGVLAAELRACLHLRFLSISDCSMAFSPKPLETAITGLKRLEGLTLQKLHAVFDGDHEAFFLDLLTNNPSLGALDLPQCELANEDLAHLGEALVQTRLTRLRRLGLAGNAFTTREPGWGRDLANVGHQNSAQAAGALGRCLKATPSLQSLNLDDCAIDDSFIEPLAEALAHNTSLRHLHLAGNKIGQLGGHLLAAALRQNHHLRGLDLTGNPLPEVILNELVHAVQVHPALETVLLPVGAKAQQRAIDQWLAKRREVRRKAEKAGSSGPASRPMAQE